MPISLLTLTLSFRCLLGGNQDSHFIDGQTEEGLRRISQGVALDFNRCFDYKSQVIFHTALPTLPAQVGGRLTGWWGDGGKCRGGD